MDNPIAQPNAATETKPPKWLGPLAAILVLALLVLLAFPAYPIMVEQANKARASAMADQLKNAMNSHFLAYGRHPALGTNTPTGDLIIESTADWRTLSALFNGSRDLVTSRTDPAAQAHNPRKTTYLSILPEDHTRKGRSYDHVISPWDDSAGLPVRYIMVLDGNGDSMLDDLPKQDGGTMSVGSTIEVYVLDPDDPTRTLINTYE